MTGLTAEQRTIWSNTGHLTVPGVFSDADMGEAEADLVFWRRSPPKTKLGSWSNPLSSAC